MRFGATVLLFGCATAYVAAFPRNQQVFKKQADPPTPTPEDPNTWPFGLMAFASLYAKCHEMELMMEAMSSEVPSEDMDPGMGTDPDMGMDHAMGTLAIACNHVSKTLEEMDSSTGVDMTAIAGFNDWFPLFQCTNLQIDREQTTAFLLDTTNDIKMIRFLQ